MGYDPSFLGSDPVYLPQLSDRVAVQAYNGGIPIDHTRFSIVLHATRSLAICTAHTIDGASLIGRGEIRRSNRFRLDPQVAPELQLDNDRGYRHNPWDRGHLVRRRSLHWGARSEAEHADSESFYWTNIAPQHEQLHDTAWGPIEDWVLGLTEAADQRASVFTGPVLTEDDPVHQNGEDEIPFQVPAGFWKILVVAHAGVRSLASFLVWQRDHDSISPVSFSPFLEQVRLTTIEFLTGLSFPDLRYLDPLRYGASAGLDAASAGSVTAEATATRTIARRVSRPNAVMSPRDIVL